MHKLNEKMTDEERIALAAKLDKELDEFIDSLEKRRYTEGWPEDRWEEEMDKHPFFMKKVPEPGDELDPLYVGMQQLKYDPDENSEEDLANNYKEDGNFNVKHKNYRMSIISYTEGLKIKCPNPEVNATLFNNRSAAHFFLKNYRSSLSDCEKALELKPDYAKAKWRAAQCANFLDRFDVCMNYCDEILHEEPANEKALDLRKLTVSRKTNKERDARKTLAANRKKIEETNRTFSQIDKRGVNFEGHKAGSKVKEEMIKPALGPLEDYPVRADAKNILYWPSAFCYPEFVFSDFLQQLSEENTMMDALIELLKEPMPCDLNRVYNPESVNVYYENRIAAKVHLVNVKKTIKEILQEKL